MRAGWGRIGLQLGWIAGVVFAIALMLGATGVPGYAHARHAVALLGADASPVATGFNIAGFALPGIALALFALALDRPLARGGVGLAGRLGWNLLLISGVAFAALSLLPYDADDPDGAGSKRHVLALTLSVLAWLPSLLLLAAGLRRQARWRGLAQAGLALGAAMLLLLALPVGDWLPTLRGAPGHAQRLLLLIYFLWPALVSVVLSRAPMAAPAQR